MSFQTEYLKPRTAAEEAACLREELGPTHKPGSDMGLMKGAKRASHNDAATARNLAGYPKAKP